MRALRHIAGAAGCGLLLSACADTPPARTDGPATRIVSLDYCADQYVLALADRDRILAVSDQATSIHSYMRDSAKGLPHVRSVAEDVLVLQPDLVVRAYGGGPGAADFFEAAGIPVLQVGWVNTLDADSPNSVSAVLREMAQGLDVPERGAAMIAEYEARLMALRHVGRETASERKTASDRSALYLTQGGVTTGPGSLIDEMMGAAGLSNFQEQPGWRPIPLERLAYDEPDVVAAAFFDSVNDNSHRWSSSRHPVARAQLQRADVVPLQGAWTACGGWFVLDAVEALATKAVGGAKP